MNNELEYPHELNTNEVHGVPDIQIEKDKLTVKYIGKGNHTRDVGTSRSSLPVPKHCDVYYFEVFIVDSGFRGSITVGLTSHAFALNTHVGADSESFGYRGENGRKFNGSAHGSSYGPFFSSGAVIGCGFNFITNEVFFTKNGESLGVAFHNVRPQPSVYPSVSLHSPGEIVRFNFGQNSKFTFNIDKFVQDEKMKLQAEISRQAIESDMYVPLVRSFLAHSGYEKTLAAWDRACPPPATATRYHSSDNGDTDIVMKDEYVSVADGVVGGDDVNRVYPRISERSLIRRHIMDGDMEEAVSVLSSVYPELMIGDSPASFRLRFCLHSQTFVELVRTHKLDEAVAFARDTLSSYTVSTTVDKNQLNKLMGLLAYPNIAESPLAYMLSPAYTEEVADIVNSICLEFEDCQRHSPLEVMLRQLMLAERTQHEINNEMGAEFSIWDC